jgi:hypothetical protein
VVVNADLARLADPPPSRVRRAVMALAWLNVLAGAGVLVLGSGPVALVLSAGNLTAFVLLTWLVDGRP